jgi:hypothetical protein
MLLIMPCWSISSWIAWRTYNCLNAGPSVGLLKLIRKYWMPNAYAAARVKPLPSGLVAGRIWVPETGGRSCGGMPPTSSCPVLSAVYSVVSSVYA